MEQASPAVYGLSSASGFLAGARKFFSDVFRSYTSGNKPLTCDDGYFGIAFNEYDVREWMNTGYTGSDPGRKCMPDLVESYRGFVRVSTAGSDDSNETDSEDKED